MYLLKKHFLQFSKSRLFHKEKRGVLLLITLWITVVLTAIAYSLSYNLQLEIKLTKMRKDSTNALAMARAGVARAIADLKNDLLFEFSEGGMTRKFDAEGDVWKRPENGKIDQTLGKDREAKYGFYNVEIIDEESKINLNTASHQVLKAALKLFDLEDEEATKIAYAIIDWRDADDKPASGEGDNESIYYAELEAGKEGAYLTDELEPVKLKNDLFVTVDELLNVYGITPEIFYGIDKDAKKKKRSTYSKSKERYLQSKEKYIQQKRLDAKKLFLGEEEQLLGLRDLFTVDSNGSVNINTAPKWVLTVLIAAATENIDDAEKAAESVIEYRRNNKKEDIDNDRAFRNIGELNSVGEVGAGILGKIGSLQKLDIKSDTFLIHSVGECGYAKKSLYVRVKRTWETFNADDPKVKEKLEQRQGSAKNFKHFKADESGKQTMVYAPTVRITLWMEK